MLSVAKISFLWMGIEFEVNNTKSRLQGYKLLLKTVNLRQCVQSVVVTSLF